jgi:H+-transporting ATPase
VLGTQTIATLIAVYGLFMAPLGWKWAGFVWGYAIVWALINDRIKLLAYKVFDPVKAEAKPEAKSEAKLDAKVDGPAEPKPESKDKPKIEAKADQPKAEEKSPLVPGAGAEALKPGAKSAEPKNEAKAEAPKTEAKGEARAKASPNLTSQIAGRAYELYEHRSPDSGTAAQDWQKAETEVRKDATDGEPKAEAKTDEPKPEANVEPQPESKPEPKPEANDKPQPDATPQLVKRVHELYEELGREDVQAVQDWEKAHPELEEHESHK